MGLFYDKKGSTRHGYIGDTPVQKICLGNLVAPEPPNADMPKPYMVEVTRYKTVIDGKDYLFYETGCDSALEREGREIERMLSLTKHLKMPAIAYFRDDNAILIVNRDTSMEEAKKFVAKQLKDVPRAVAEFNKIKEPRGVASGTTTVRSSLECALSEVSI